MTRNELFSQVHATMSADRTKFDLSKRRFSTFNQGQLVPIYVNSDILAGDTFDVMTKFKIRSRTPLSPVLDNAKVDTYWFFSPYTQLWDHAKEFYGDSKPSAYYAPVKYKRLYPPEPSLRKKTRLDCKPRLFVICLRYSAMSS